MVNRLIICTLALAMAIGAAAKKPERDTRTAALHEAVRSLQITDGKGHAVDLPVIGLSEYSRDNITVEFDVMHPERDYLRARLVPCTADWKVATKLGQSEFVDGFNNSSITQFAFSGATSVPYTHYAYTLPSPFLRPKLSGNYLLEIVNEDDPDTPWAQVRFMVTENAVGISTGRSSATDVDYNDAHQQLNITLNTQYAHVDNPFNDLLVVITQNGRTDNAATLTRPLRADDREAVYEHQPELIFPAGNEYRRFETVSTERPNMHVSGLPTFAEPYYHFTLDTDLPRNESPYSSDRTQAGRWQVRNADIHGANDATDADYAVVHFSLKTEELPDADVYIDGDLANHRLDSETLMQYNPATGCYERALLLKQGSYNYQYLVVPRGTTTGLTATLEGDRHATRNEYQVAVYHRPPGARHHRLLGTTVVK